MRIGIDSGHNCSPDTGAVGIMSEDKITKEVGSLVINKLTQLGHRVTDCLPPAASSVNESLRLRCTFANRDNVNVYVSIHANKTPGGFGSEVWYKSDAGLKLGQPILDELVSLGYHNRGMKKAGVDGSNLYVLSNTNAPAVLVELFFVDSQADCDIYNPENLANAIVKGLTGQAVQNKQEVKKVSKYDESIPTGVFQIPGTTGYIEQATDGRLIIHKDRGNYIAIGKGFIDTYWNDNNGTGGSKRIGG